MQALLKRLQDIDPTLESLKLDSSSINKHPELRRVIDNHTIGGAYMRQYFKQPLVDDCQCKACQLGLWGVLRLPAAACADIVNHKQAHQPTFIQRQQQKGLICVGDGMQLTAQKEDMATTELAPNLLKGKYVRGVVTCKDCMRPRCMYSLTHPRNMEPAATVVDGKKVQPSVTEKAECKQYALQNFHAAAEHNSFLSGMQPFDDNHPLHGVLVTRSNITCGSLVEFEYYSTQTKRATWFDANTCAWAQRATEEQLQPPAQQQVEHPEEVEVETNEIDEKEERRVEQQEYDDLLEIEPQQQQEMLETMEDEQEQ
eukprot:jgi/Tetstr1/421518/TSEL_012465.t1